MNRATLPVALLSALLLSACAAKGKPSAAAPSGGHGGEGASVTMAAPGDVSSERAASEPMAVAADADEEAEPEPEFDRSIQAGTLTAGVFDDSKNPDVMRAFASHMRNNQASSTLAAALDGPITVLQIVDADGRPVGNAKVDAGRALLSRTDGRVVLTGLDAGPNAGDTLTVGVEVQGRKHRARVERGDGVAKIRLPFRAAAAPKALDVALVIDATGSMSDEIEYLKVEIRSIANAIDRAFPNVDQRYALVVYRDEGDEYVTRTFDFTDDVRTFERRLGRQHADGGGDYPEAMHLALADTANLSWREGNVARVSFLVADAPPHAEDTESAIGAADELRSLGVATYPVAASGVAEEAELVMRAAALMSGGQYIFLTDDSGVGNTHAEPHIPCYAVEHLATAMTRMIRSELSGQRVEADPQRTIRTVGSGRGGVCEVPKLTVAR